MRIRRLASIIPAFVFLVLAFMAAQQALGAMYAEYVRGITVNGKNKTRALKAIGLATTLNADNYEYYTLSAWLHSSLGDQEQADRDYARSLRLAPGWPYTWAAAARFVASQAGDGEKLDLALSESLRLGNADGAIRSANTTTAIKYWYRLSSEQRELLEPGIMASLSTPRGEIEFREKVFKEGRHRLFCRRFANWSERGPNWCRRWRLPVPDTGTASSS